jgi:hypothetical protein
MPLSSSAHSIQGQPCNPSVLDEGVGGLSRSRCGRLHFEDGCGSLWTCAWLRSAAGGEDGDRCGGCRHGGKPFCQASGHGGVLRSGNDADPGASCDGLVCFGDRDGGQQSSASSGPCRGTDCRPGTWSEAGFEARQPALWRNGMEDVHAPVGRVVAGGCGRRLRALRPVRRNGSVASARRVACKRG